MEQYYYLHQGAVKGPEDLTTLVDRWKKGALPPDVQVCAGKGQAWTQLRALDREMLSAAFAELERQAAQRREAIALVALSKEAARQAAGDTEGESEPEGRGAVKAVAFQRTSGSEIDSIVIGIGYIATVVCYIMALVTIFSKVEDVPASMTSAVGATKLFVAGGYVIFGTFGAWMSRVLAHLRSIDNK